MKKDFEFFEIDLTGTCNLKCERCSRNYMHSQHLVKKNIRSLNDIIKQLDTFKMLKECSIAGQVSEPTLYPQLIEFLQYLKKRKIKIDLFTNASILKQDLFKKIGLVLDKNDRVHFSICGSTQELHQKYRVGSKLDTILKNARALREVNKIDFCQYIRFDYNFDDWKSNVWKKLGFSNYYWVESEGQRLFNDVKRKILYYPKKQKFYNLLFKQLNSFKKYNYECQSLRDKKIYIDQFGREFPCYLIAEYNNEFDFTKFNYSMIGNFDCCKLCSKECEFLMKRYNLEFVC